MFDAEDNPTIDLVNEAKRDSDAESTGSVKAVIVKKPVSSRARRSIKVEDTEAETETPLGRSRRTRKPKPVDVETVEEPPAKTPRRKKRMIIGMPREKPRTAQKTKEKFVEPKVEVKVESEVDGPSRPSSAASSAHSIEPTVPLPLPLHLYSPFQLVLDQFLRIFQRNDPDNFFMFPVTDDVAPNYSVIIKQPTDFSSMRVRLNNDEYKTMNDFKADVLLICSNAIAYNNPDTIYYSAARSLQSVMNKMFVKERLIEFSRCMPFMKKLTQDQLGFPVEDLGGPVKIRSLKKNPSYLMDDLTAQQIIVSAQSSSERAAKQLSSRKSTVNMACLNQNDDGAITLKFLTPRCGQATDVGFPTISSLVEPLKSGTPGLPLFSESVQNKLTPVQPLFYDAYSSGAPIFDSTWATLNKTDSQLLAAYGTETGVDYAKSLMNFTKDGDKYLTDMVDGILDTLTQGAHSKLMNPSSVESTSQCSADESPPQTSIDIESLKTLSSLGINVDFLDSPEVTGLVTANDKPAAESTVSTMLKKNEFLINDLQDTQRRRLAQTPTLVLSDTKGPSPVEQGIADQIVSNLVQCASQVPPGSLVKDPMQRLMSEPTNGYYFEQPAGVTKSQSISPDDGYDMDLLREFLQV